MYELPDGICTVCSPNITVISYFYHQISSQFIVRLEGKYMSLLSVTNTSFSNTTIYFNSKITVLPVQILIMTISI